MDNLLIDLKIQNKKLEKENLALKKKIEEIYKDWLYDTNKHMEFKAKVKTLFLSNPLVQDA